MWTNASGKVISWYRIFCRQYHPEITRSEELATWQVHNTIRI